MILSRSTHFKVHHIQLYKSIKTFKILIRMIHKIHLNKKIKKKSQVITWLRNKSLSKRQHLTNKFSPYLGILRAEIICKQLWKRILSNLSIRKLCHHKAASWKFHLNTKCLWKRDNQHWSNLKFNLNLKINCLRKMNKLTSIIANQFRMTKMNLLMLLKFKIKMMIL